MKKFMRSRGFTLIEMVIVIFLVGMLSVMITRFLTQGLISYLAAQSVTEANWAGRVAIERMIRDIRQVRSPSDITTMTATEFAFVDVLGITEDYKLSGTTLTLNGNLLANGISNLAFTYYSSTGAVAATAANLNYMYITLGVSLDNSNYSLSTAVYLRNMSL